MRKVTTIALCMDPELAEQLRARAADHGLSVSAYTRQLLRDGLNERKWEAVVKTALDFIPCWVPVTERMPEIPSTVIVYGRMRYKWEADYVRFVDAAAYTEDGIFETFHDWYEGQDEFEITHWQPLPELPKEVQRDGDPET